jgi:dipeptidyl aminopeptidase/acylaminoacyl peptidase
MKKQKLIYGVGRMTGYSLSSLAVYNFENNDMILLGDDTLKVYASAKMDSDILLAASNKQYQKTYNWEYPYKTDYYTVNRKNGNRKLIRQGLIHEVNLSPKGKYLTFFKQATKQQYLLDLETNIETCITCSEKEEWLEDVNGMPYVADPLGIVGWTENEKSLLIQSKYDLWEFQISSLKLINITRDIRGNDKIRFSLKNWNQDSIYLNIDNIYVTGFYETDKSMSLYKAVHSDEKLFSLVEKVHTNHNISGIKKAENSENYVFQKTSLEDYSDVFLANWKDSTLAKRLSVTNPQQSEFNWATVELISWNAYDKTPLNGLLYKPENFDTAKRYPLLVYFYELYSDDLHNHYAPRPTASIIFPTEYASAGYVVLIPDIRYKEGQPGKDAYNAIMSATDYVLKKYPNIDSSRMGLQGQSWGGYQTAQLITMTKRYKAAMAGAPVSNMFSAYGGIRWGSGLNRQFQYERTQSRIGKTIWEAPALYIENSPLFHLPKVETPLMIMHNDADGAVPWYQGIELFTGLKRLGKPVWLLNYNGDDHNLMKSANRMDLSIRMRQFFDYYLQGLPAPKWLIEGVPALQKGKENVLSY